MSATDGVVATLGALAGGDWSRAVDAAAVAARSEPRRALAVALDAFLAGQPAAGVYDEPTAFEAFIDHGTNPELYRRTIEVVRGVHAEAQPATVVDIGCGDGRVTAAVLAAASRRVDLVEPSAALLALAAGVVAAPARTVVPHTQTLAEFAATVEAGTRWALAQSTFALHTTHPDDRPALLTWLAAHVERLLVVEFDVPAFADRSPEHLAYLADRYEVGVREYAAHPEAIDGFLMPVLVGQLDPARPRYTFEQPIAEWCRELADGGFTTTQRPVYDYWWGAASLIEARPVRS